MKGTLNSLVDRMAKLLFKFSVEQAMMQVLAYTCEIDENTLNKLRGYCVMECKRINGAVTFDDAVRFQKSSD
jgi:hypothetical protein